MSASVYVCVLYERETETWGLDQDHLCTMPIRKIHHKIFVLTRTSIICVDPMKV